MTQIDKHAPGIGNRGPDGAVGRIDLDSLTDGVDGAAGTTDIRKQVSALLEELRRHPGRFEFSQAVRVLERERGVNTIRFRTDLSLRFPGRVVTSVSDAGEWDEMMISFMGLVGPSGVLPDHYTTILMERLREKDSATRDFFDIFVNRLVTLHYEAKAKHHAALSSERARLTAIADRSAPDEDLLTRCVRSLVGLGTGGLDHRLDCGDERAMFYAGHYSRLPKCAVSLELLLCDTFETDVQILQFQGRWREIGDANRTSMPAPGDRGPRNCPRNNALGSETVCGSRIWDVQGCLRVRLGPMSLEQFKSFTPDREVNPWSLPQLWSLVRLYAGVEFDFDVQPVLRAEEVPACVLGDASSGAGRLGWTTWLRSEPATKDFDGIAFELRNEGPYIN